MHKNLILPKSYLLQLVAMAEVQADATGDGTMAVTLKAYRDMVKDDGSDKIIVTPVEAKLLGLTDPVAKSVLLSHYGEPAT